MLSDANPRDVSVPNNTVPPGTTAKELAEESFMAAPPTGPNTSIPTFTVELIVFVHANIVARGLLFTTPSTVQACTLGLPWSVWGALI